MICLRFLLFTYIIHLCTGSCDLPSPLTNAGLKKLDDNCVEVNGNLLISDEHVNDILLNRKFKKVSTIFGCVNIMYTYMNNFKFMSNIRIINCSLTPDNEELNVIDIKFNYYLKKYSWDSLKTIIGPGDIILKDGNTGVCLSMHEVELLLFHPQYHGDEWRYLYEEDGPIRCYEIKKECFFIYEPPDRINFDENCRVMINFTLSHSPGFLPIPELNKLRNVRIILGGITIKRSWLIDLASILPNLELIYASVLESGGQPNPPIWLIDNPYLSNISFPKLRRLKNSVSTSVFVEGSPLLSPTTNLYEGVQNIFFELLPDDQTIDYRGSTNFGKFSISEFFNTNTWYLSINSISVKIKNDERLDSETYKFNMLIYGIYYPPIIISLLFNLRALVLFLFGSSKYSIGHLRWFYFGFLLVHLLIAVDSLILYHDLTMVYFTPAPLLPKIIIFSDTLLVLCKTLFVFREIAMDIPLAFILYVFMAIAMNLIKKSPRIPSYIYIFIVILYAGFEAVTLYLTVDVRARRTMNTGFLDEESFPMDKYSMVAAINGNFSLENHYIKDDANSIISYLVYESTIYTDGLFKDMTPSKQILEYVTVGLFGIYFLTKFIDQSDRYFKLPYDWALILIILVQYSVLRYAALRNHLIREVYPIYCIGDALCAERYSFTHTLTMITHHFFYVLLGLCSVLVWYTARYYHFLGAMIKSESLLEAARMEWTREARS